MSPVFPASLSLYRRHVGGLARPSPAQIAGFVEFVCDAHSWYKHLPLFPPGVPFHFFLDPFAGYGHVLTPGGGLRLEEVTETTPCFHYTWMTTAAYRRRFGYLQYGAAAGTYFRLQTGDEVREYANGPIFHTTMGNYHLPPEILDAGSVELTGVIHPLARGSLGTWDLMLHRHARRHAQDHPEYWPRESGGEATLHRIKEILDRYNAYFLAEECADEDEEAWPLERQRLEEQLAALVLPEARRLQGQMIAAIHRMLALL
jgi:hypothetical protein